MIRKFQRDGTPYPDGRDGLLQWAIDLENPQKTIVRHNELLNGYEVSTVWTGLALNRFGPPLIFETMVFLVEETGKRSEVFFHRYATEDDAIAAHKDAVEAFAPNQ